MCWLRSLAIESCGCFLTTVNSICAGLVVQESNGKLPSVQRDCILPLAAILVPLHILLHVADEHSIRGGLRRARPHARPLIKCVNMLPTKFDLVVCPRRIRHSHGLTLCAARKAFFLNYLLARISRYQEGIMDQLFNSSEKRLARALLLLAGFGNGGNPEAVVPKVDQEELAKVVGTTRSRISFFMNRFRKLGFVAYKRKSPITIRTAKLSRFVMA